MCLVSLHSYNSLHTFGGMPSPAWMAPQAARRHKQNASQQRYLARERKKQHAS